MDENEDETSKNIEPTEKEKDLIATTNINCESHKPENVISKSTI